MNPAPEDFFTVINYAISYAIGYGIDNAIVFAINLKVDYYYHDCYSTIFGYDISNCLRLLIWLCLCLFLLCLHLTMALLWLCVDYSINHL
jgi:hypothetical protein